MPENTGGRPAPTESENMLSLRKPSGSLSPAPASHTPDCARTFDTHHAISDLYMWAENVFRLPDKHLNLWSS